MSMIANPAQKYRPCPIGGPERPHLAEQDADSGAHLDEHRSARRQPIVVQAMDARNQVALLQDAGGHWLQRKSSFAFLLPPRRTLTLSAS